MADDLLEALVRPDNLIEYQVNKEIKFIESHRVRLVEVEQAICPSTAPVSDTAADAVLFGVQPAERVDIIDLISTSDEAFNKIMIVFTALSEEIHYLKNTAESKFYDPLSLFGYTQHDDKDELGEGLLEAMAGRSLPLFQDASNFVGRVNAVVLNMVKQIQALFTPASLFGRGGKFATGFAETRLKPLLLSLGDAFTILATLDAILEGNPLIRQAWEKFKRVADIMRVDPAKYGAEPVEASAFDGLLTELDAALMQGRTLRRCLDQNFEESREVADVAAYRDFLRDRSIDNVDGLVSSCGSDSELDEAKAVVGQFAVYALHRALDRGRTKPEDVKAQYVRLWRVCDRLPLVVLHGVKALWTPDGFLTDVCPVAGIPPKLLLPKEPRAVRTASAEALAERLPALANQLQARVAAWTVRAETAFADTPLVASQQAADVIRARGLLLTQAVCLAAGGNRALTFTIAYALLLQRGFKRSLVEPLARIAILLKALEGSVRKFSSAIGETVVHLYRSAAADVLGVLAPLRLRAGASKKSDDSLRFLAAATEMLTHVLHGSESFTPVRRKLLDMGLSLCVQKAGVAKDAEVAILARTSWTLFVLAEHASLSRRYCDTSVVYHARDVFPAMLQSVCTLRGSGAQDGDPRHGLALHHLFAAASDAGQLLSCVIHLPPPPAARERVVPAGPAAAAGTGTGAGKQGKGKDGEAEADPEDGLGSLVHPLTAYERFLHDLFHTEVVAPLARAVEADLRVTVHAVHLAHMEPPSARTGRPPMVHLLSAPPVRILGTSLDIGGRVTRYLERTFYELTTVALHDWKTYGEMASVASDKYGLDLADNHLPMGCLDAGLDVLQIMRNIHVFVGRYVYNMNQQFFVEKRAVKGAKHLNVVSVRSIGASIRQHGSGMLNTTVNFAYQFLAQKFYVFSQFLFDEYIKSHLAKERRFYRRERRALDNRYPVDRAMAFTKDVRSLGVGADKTSFLDKFRVLIAEMGGALGYVRLVRAAGMAAAAEGAQFVPDLNEVINFAEAAARVGQGASTGEGLSDETSEACGQLDAVLAQVTSSFGSGSDYLHLLVTVFQHVLASQAGTPAGGSGPAGGPKRESDSHLRNFFLIVPALTLSYVEALKAGKDRLEKSVKGAETSFCDDGFAMGIAYLLAVLRQDAMFDSLHWWDSVLRHHKSEIGRYKLELSACKPSGKGSSGSSSGGVSKADADRVDELTFKIKRAAALQGEYDQLFFAFASARTFFKREGGDEEEVALKL